MQEPKVRQRDRDISWAHGNVHTKRYTEEEKVCLLLVTMTTASPHCPATQTYLCCAIDTLIKTAQKRNSRNIARWTGTKCMTTIWHLIFLTSYRKRKKGELKLSKPSCHLFCCQETDEWMRNKHGLRHRDGMSREAFRASANTQSQCVFDYFKKVPLRSFEWRLCLTFFFKKGTQLSIYYYY